MDSTVFYNYLVHVLMFILLQAVPTVQEGDAQTDLRHPKNLAIQYEARVFGPEEVEKIWNSSQMKRKVIQKFHNIGSLAKEIFLLWIE